MQILQTRNTTKLGLVNQSNAKQSKRFLDKGAGRNLCVVNWVMYNRRPIGKWRKMIIESSLSESLTKKHSDRAKTNVFSWKVCSIYSLPQRKWIVLISKASMLPSIALVFRTDGQTCNLLPPARRLCFWLGRLFVCLSACLSVCLSVCLRAILLESWGWLCIKL